MRVQQAVIKRSNGYGVDGNYNTCPHTPTPVNITLNDYQF